MANAFYQPDLKLFNIENYDVIVTQVYKKASGNILISDQKKYWQKLVVLDQALLFYSLRPDNSCIMTFFTSLV
jgi:hypothetical protein